MKFTEEDEHYIQEISPSPDGSTCIVKRTEKPKKVILGRKLTDGNYEFLVNTTSKSKDDITYVHFRHKEEYFIEGTYDYKKKRFDDNFVKYIKKISDKKTTSYKFLKHLKEYIEDIIDMYRDVEGTIKKLKASIKSKENIIALFRKYNIEDGNEIEEELENLYELLLKFEKIYSYMKKNEKSKEI